MKKVNPDVKARILAAAESLEAEGIENPTNAQVLDRMGKGSLSDVSPVMRERRAKKQDEVEAALEMPAELRRVVELSLGQVWKVASHLASDELRIHREKADTKVDEIENELEEALAENRRLSTTVEELKSQIEALNSKNIDLQAELDRERKQALKNATEIAALSARVDDRNIQVGNLKEELKEAKADNKRLQNDLLALAKRNLS